MNNNYDNLKVENITRRWSYPHITEILAREFNTENKELPLLGLGQINIFKNDFVEYNWALKIDIWEDFFDFYKDKLDFIKDEINYGLKKAQRLLKTNSIINLKYYCELVGLAMRISAVIRGIDVALQPKINTILSEKEVGLATMFEEEPLASEEETCLLELSIKKRIIKDLKGELKKVYEKYKWIAYGLYNEKPVSFEEYYRNFEKIISPEKLLKEKENIKKRAILERDKIISKLNNKDKFIVLIAQKLSYLKDLNKIFMTTCTGLAKPLWKMLSEKANISEEIVLHLFSNEIIEIIEGKKVDFSKVLSRMKNIVFIGLPSEFRILYGKEAEEFEKKYILEDTSKIMNGRIACKGKASGKAKIVLGRHDFNKMEKGDILVVSNTTPDYVQIMKKASAILAEEGGLTAHVSVVSREFGIPCIVGIKNITKTLKDNQLVEVDANIGIVKIL